MKKKLKVKKAAIGSAIQGRRGGRSMPRPVIGGRPGINVNPNLINPIRPGMQPGVTPFKPIGPEFGPRDQPLPPMQPSSQIDPNSPRNIIFANPVRPGTQQSQLPTGQVGDPRLGAATIPGNKLQMQMRGPQQAAPVQPVPAMKKGGIVRGGRAETKGTRPAKLY
jgi:hypothetical protein